MDTSSKQLLYFQFYTFIYGINGVKTTPNRALNAPTTKYAYTHSPFEYIVRTNQFAKKGFWTINIIFIQAQTCTVFTKEKSNIKLCIC